MLLKCDLSRFEPAHDASAMKSMLARMKTYDALNIINKSFYNNLAN